MSIRNGDTCQDNSIVFDLIDIFHRNDIEASGLTESESLNEYLIGCRNNVRRVSN